PPPAARGLGGRRGNLVRIGLRRRRRLRRDRLRRRRLGGHGPRDGHSHRFHHGLGFGGRDHGRLGHVRGGRLLARPAAFGGGGGLRDGLRRGLGLDDRRGFHHELRLDRLDHGRFRRIGRRAPAPAATATTARAGRLVLGRRQ